MLALVMGSQLNQAEAVTPVHIPRHSSRDLGTPRKHRFG